MIEIGFSRVQQPTGVLAVADALTDVLGAELRAILSHLLATFKTPSVNELTASKTSVIHRVRGRRGRQRNCPSNLCNEALPEMLSVVNFAHVEQDHIVDCYRSAP